jgi:ADP-ribosylglycohydrolase
MTRYIRRYIESAPDVRRAERTTQGLAVFCFQNTDGFTQEFLKRVGIEAISAPPRHADTTALAEFADQLLWLNQECIFLLRDTYQVMCEYHARAGRGFGMLVNRRFLCRDRNEEDYFALVQPIYDVLPNCADAGEFLARYVGQIRALIDSDPHWRRVAGEIVRYVDSHAQSSSIVWVDWGAQFTFSLFCYASIDILSKRSFRQQFQSFTAYPWLPSFLRDWFFSDDIRLTVPMELRGRRAYANAVEDRARGTFLGFAIGDSLGFPAAGIEAGDVARFVSLPVRRFAANPLHPFFSRLVPGQFTDNTTLLMTSANTTLRTPRFDLQRYAEDLADWTRRRIESPDLQRWPGPTAMEGGKRLLMGLAGAESGSTTSESCSALYRIIPLALAHRPFVADTTVTMVDMIDRVCALTHRTDEARQGCRLLAVLVADLLVGCPPETAVAAALHEMGPPENGELVRRITRVVRERGQLDDDQARRFFRTSSLMRETLPLALLFFLKYRNDFRAAVLAAANSFRVDSAAERARLGNHSWKEQLQLARGGNTDGIAAITGALAACYLGLNRIPSDFRGVEGAADLAKDAGQLVADSL